MQKKREGKDSGDGFCTWFFTRKNMKNSSDSSRSKRKRDNPTMGAIIGNRNVIQRDH